METKRYAHELSTYNFSQSKAVGHFSIDVADGLMHHINAAGPQCPFALPTAVFWRLRVNLI